MERCGRRKPSTMLAPAHALALARGAPSSESSHCAISDFLSASVNRVGAKYAPRVAPPPIRQSAGRRGVSGARRRDRLTVVATYDRRFWVGRLLAVRVSISIRSHKAG